MSSPTCTATLNKSSYAIGETMVLTVNHTDADRMSFAVTVQVTDPEGNTSPPATATATIDAGTVNFVDSGGKTWTLQSATLNQSIYTTTA